MATLGSGNDNPNIDGGVTSFVDFGGNDTYTIIPSLSANVTITDNQASTINLPAGMDISAASFSANGVQFTVNGFTVTFIGNPSLFTFVFGGTPLDPNLGTKKTFAETATAFGTTIPAPGDDPNAATQTGPVDAGGTVGQTLAISASANSVDEGASVNVSVTGAAANSTVAYTISGVDAADVDSLTGTITTDANGAGSAAIAAIADKATEGPETMKVTLDGTTVATDVIINDTSIAPTSSLTVTAAAASVNEGDTAVFNIATTNVAEGTTVSYVIGGNVSDSAGAGDITGPLTGTATIGADGKATISVAVTSDNVTEGSETLTLTAAAGQLSDTANTIINDTSTSPSALTTADDTITGGAGDDSYTGVSSALSSERTLNPNDKIDGGAGNDTLSVDMKVDFPGFSSTGFLKNVENVNLSNTGSIGRVFDASGATGVQTYKLNGDVSLRDLDSAATGVTVENRDLGIVTIDYADDAIKGTSDTLALGVNGLGTAEVPASTGVTAAAEQAVIINATSNTGAIETAAITASGTSFISLGSNVGTSAVTVSGAGNVAIRDVASTLKTFDASQATGNAAIDFAGTSGVTSVKGGSGNDGFTVNRDDLVVNATVDGGMGSDTLLLKGAFDNGGTATPLQLAMSGVETIALDTASGLIFSAVNTSGVEKISVAGDSTVNFASLGSSNLAFDLNGETASGVVAADNSGTATVSVAKPKSDANSTNKATVNKSELALSKASQVDLTVADKMDYQGKLTATEATSVTAAIKGKATGAEINAGKATSVVISEVSGDASSLKLVAGSATSVQVTNAKNLDLSVAGSDLGKVESFTSSGAGKIETGNLGAANQVTISNAGDVTIGKVGSATQQYSANVTLTGTKVSSIGDIATQNQGVSVSGTNLTGDFSVKSIAAGSGNVNVTASTTGNATLTEKVDGKSVTVDFSGALQEVTVGDKNAVGTTGITATTANVTGTGTAKNTVVATADNFTIKGGLFADELLLDGNSIGSNSKVTNTLNVTTDLGDDTVSYTTNGTASLATTLTGTVNLGGNTATGDTLNITVGGTAASVNASGLTVSGAENINITGNAGANTLVGTSGNDAITGFLNATVTDRDVMAGLGGNDTITGTASVDEIHFRSVDGSDLLKTLVFGTDNLGAGNQDKIHFLDNGTTGGTGAVNFAASDANGNTDSKGTDFVSGTDNGAGSTKSYNEFASLTALGTGHDAAASATNESNKVLKIDAQDQKTAVEAFTESGLLNAYLVVDQGNDVLIYFDADWSTTADRSLVATLEAVDIVGIDVTDFGVYTTVA